MAFKEEGNFMGRRSISKAEIHLIGRGEKLTKEKRGNVRETDKTRETWERKV